MTNTDLADNPIPVIAATPATIIGLKNLPASARALLLALTRLSAGALTVSLPDGRRLSFGTGDSPRATLDVHDIRFAKRVLTDGDIGFADGWIEGEWSSPELAALLTLLAANADQLMPMLRGGPLARAAHWVGHVLHANTRRGARRNILAHYDLGNRFFEAWLDRTMTYSSARFDLADGLENAQQAKYRVLAERLELVPGDHVLEIGCGWGGFSEVAAKEYGAHVTAITISDEQFAYARDRMQRIGAAGQVAIKLEDYRDTRGVFDKVASIEMLEAVGEKNWPAYFSKIAEVLKPGGRAAVQVITMRDDLFDAYRHRADFIQRYIFPGGMLPSIERLREEAAKAGLEWRGLEAFGKSYADTLAEWAQRFRAKWDEISGLGFDERFKRLWLFYLGYCEAGFRSGRTDVIQLHLAKPS
jgi:cyclopropane-fatty-acyl-phospholipid synthase